MSKVTKIETINGVKRSQYTKATAEAFAVSLKADIKKAHVEAMLEACEKGQKELAGENPEEFIKLFGQVLTDYEAAKGEVAAEAAAKQKKIEDARAEVENKVKAENDLFLSVKDSTADFATLGKTFDTGNMDRFVPKENVSDKDLLIALNTGLRMGDFSNWMIGDLVKELEDRNQLNVVGRLAESTGKAYSSIYNAAKTSRAVPPEKRGGASYTIFSEIANARFSKEEDKNLALQNDLVDKASKGEFTTQSAREEVKKAKGVAPKPTVLPEDDSFAKFLFINEDGTYGVAVGFPRAEFDGGATVINPKTLSTFGSFRAKPENRWTEIEVTDAPEPKVEAPAKAAKPAKPAKAKK